MANIDPFLPSLTMPAAPSLAYRPVRPRHQLLGGSRQLVTEVNEREICARTWKRDRSRNEMDINTALLNLVVRAIDRSADNIADAARYEDELMQGLCVETPLAWFGLPWVEVPDDRED